MGTVVIQPAPAVVVAEQCPSTFSVVTDHLVFTRCMLPAGHREQLHRRQKHADDGTLLWSVSWSDAAAAWG